MDPPNVSIETDTDEHLMRSMAVSGPLRPRRPVEEFVETGLQLLAQRRDSAPAPGPGSTNLHWSFWATSLLLRAQNERLGESEDSEDDADYECTDTLDDEQDVSEEEEEEEEEDSSEESSDSDTDSSSEPDVVDISDGSDEILVVPAKRTPKSRSKRRAASVTRAQSSKRRRRR